ncbi:hypothetical protein RHMOL_Rhmol11G0050800 [Rhododendron molle]|uniref:Uncharacterized protein n=1 Tax=Rhododendron molle TaxID=49168 RepID=A0ACC0LNR4_RHOML|nr:hypothetical protein RHMOL_Rhmol11G0050800 [Rhododendron molle]
MTNRLSTSNNETKSESQNESRREPSTFDNNSSESQHESRREPSTFDNNSDQIEIAQDCIQAVSEIAGENPASENDISVFAHYTGFKAFGLGFREVQELRFRFSKDFQGLKALDKSEGGFARAWVRFSITEEIERQLAAKEASLPQEPTSDNENAVTLLVRMPDGSRHGRRFLKSDKLQSLFYFIDVGRGVKPGSYRLVRPYPRRAFDDGESASTLNELGLTSKQEALFLELI